jgi:beta-RFAP synthase
MTRVVAPSRLHFGLLHVPVEGLIHWPDGTPVRHFGGLGLMIDRPGLEVRVEPADEWSATGPLADRALGFAYRLTGCKPDFAGRHFRIDVIHAPPEHVGLGVGTQFGLAVARGLLASVGLHHTPTVLLAEKLGRGERSGVGIHGFERGGFLLDGGKLPGQPVSALAAHLDFPEEWWVVVAYPTATPGWHGEAERAAFARPRPPDDALRTTERLARLAATAILPALVERNYPVFGEALHEFNRTAGEPFARDQGGTHSSSEASRLIHAMRREIKVPAVGQSSWGPAEFAIAPDPERALHLCEWLRDELPDSHQIVMCQGNNTGAVVT